MLKSSRKNLVYVFAVLSAIFSVSGGSSLWAQSLRHSGGSNYTLVERTNLRQYVNGKYVGLTSREVRSFIFQEDDDGSTVYYSGDFYVEQDTVRKMQTVGSGIHDAIPSSFSISSDGRLTMETDNGYPTFRSFPVFPKEEISAGAQWKGESFRAVDPLNNGVITRIPMTVLYTFVGRENYKGQEVYRIKCEWATRYGISYWDFGGDLNLKSATGSHNGYVLVSVENGAMVFMWDNVDESFIYKDGTKVDYKGTILNFTEYPVSYGHEEILDSLKKMGAVIAKSDEKDVATNDEKDSLSSEGKTIEEKKRDISEALSKSESKILVEETDAGVKLSLHDLKFKADSDELMPGETKRLDEIAAVLKKLPSSMFLVEGHTADTGYKEGEMNVSTARARRIAMELAKRGVDEGRFICKGLGASKPVASNDTAEGKAMNRRVEITILE